MPLAESFLRSGKVRDLYDIDADTLLLVASDRLSAFDVILPTAIPDKGRVLTGLSRFWFGETTGIVPNHLRSTAPSDLPPGTTTTELAGRIMICRRARVLPIEVIVRGYLAGSGWKDYRRTGAVSGIDLPDGLRHSDRLPAPIFTPSTKAELGTHDENISFDEMIDRLVPIADDLEMAGALAERVRSIALALYGYGAAIVARAGILLADTKFEFGLSAAGELLLIDEVLTPDSSRFWDAHDYQPGRAQASYDKQFVRDYLESQPWNKTPPGPELPEAIVAGTRKRYVEAFERITGASFQRYLDEDVIAR
ncbi:MAG TPA: phosphoribosylaminoimidazolesuccinocarboxamide synthase [Candidatus Limnocylindrales bacterium]